EPDQIVLGFAAELFLPASSNPTTRQQPHAGKLSRYVPARLRVHSTKNRPNRQPATTDGLGCLERHRFFGSPGKSARLSATHAQPATGGHSRFHELRRQSGTHGAGLEQPGPGRSPEAV